MKPKLTVGSLFSGIGGFDIGLERAGFEIAWQVENNDYCREVLKQHWPTVPCHYDIKAIDWRDIPRVDLVCGGFPCQPFSLAGKRRGAADDRYLWPEVVRCLDALRPTWFLGENVPGLINLALDQVCTDLESLGYTVWPVCVPACAVDAPHIRQRVWIVAYRLSDEDNSERGVSECGRIAVGRDQQTAQQENGEAGSISIDRCGEDVAHTECTGSQGHRGERGLGEGGEEIEAGRGGDVADAISLNRQRRSARIRWRIGKYQETESDGGRGIREADGMWLPEPELGRVAHGVPRKLDGAGLDEKELNQEGGTASNTNADSVRDVRCDGQLTEASPELCRAGAYRDSLPYMPSQSRPTGRDAESEANESLQSLRQGLSALSHEKAQHMQQGMSGRNRKKKRHEAVGQPWPDESSDIPRVTKGVKNRVDRLKGLGNAIVPQVAEVLGRLIIEADATARPSR